ncbi:tetratricopeptide repeat protein [Sphingomonas aracearum]|uniref:Tetratricopeptide repeat protein n=1 Tax=Sphingomonas aracearum TaxID=2283317 RepID=A0A369W3C0_9SPHN|nr:tetratricopeptide repeat protein [Sphingomonas aracearum]
MFEVTPGSFPSAPKRQVATTPLVSRSHRFALNGYGERRYPPPSLCAGTAIGRPIGPPCFRWPTRSDLHESACATVFEVKQHCHRNVTRGEAREEDEVTKLALAGMLLALSAPVAAQVGGDHNGAAQIAQGDYPAAERVLVRSLKVDANDPELLLNLATVYARTDRADRARALYQQVLAAPDERLAVGGGDVLRAHALAQSGLQRLQPLNLASR